MTSTMIPYFDISVILANYHLVQVASSNANVILGWKYILQMNHRRYNVAQEDVLRQVATNMLPYVHCLNQRYSVLAQHDACHQ